jgi:hypothetical protein
MENYAVEVGDADGSGSDTAGYWLASAGPYKIIVAPKSTEVTRAWDPSETDRGTYSSYNSGYAASVTLAALGSTACPAAYYCRTLSTGGFNTWYLPAYNELMTLASSKNKTPFATSNGFVATSYWTTLDAGGAWAFQVNMSNGTSSYIRKSYVINVRAIRRSLV